MATVDVPESTRGKAVLVKRVLDQLWQPSFHYHKTGVLLTHLRQVPYLMRFFLFGAEAGEALRTIGDQDQRLAALLALMDTLNKR